MGRDGLVFVNVRKDIVKLKKKANLAQAPFMEHGKGTSTRWSHCQGYKKLLSGYHALVQVFKDLFSVKQSLISARESISQDSSLKGLNISLFCEIGKPEVGERSPVSSSGLIT